MTPPDDVGFAELARAIRELSPPGAQVVTRLPKAVDVTLTFHTTYAALARRLQRCAPHHRG